MKRRSVARSARYGQACRSCTKAKCRCVVRTNADGCERCYRLKKTCQPSEPVRRHTARDTQESGERVALLESKLDCLVSQLQARQVLGDGSDGRAGPSASTAIESQEPSRTQPDTLLAATSSRSLHSNGLAEEVAASSLAEPYGPGLAKGLNTITTSLPTDPTTAAPIAAGSGPLEDDLPFTSCLGTFTSDMLPYFPIVHFPPGMTVERLRHDRPLLLRAIVCVAWPSLEEKRARALELKRSLLDAFVMRNHRDSDQSSEENDSSIDLLLALLTYVAWGWDHIHGRGSLSYLITTCMSLVGDMFVPCGLHTANIFAPSSEARDVVVELSSECWRAILGCFILSSTISSFYANINSTNWTPQMEQVLATVSAGQECPSDASLVLQVRIQLLCLKATKLRCHLHELPSQAQPALVAASVTIDAKGLLEQVQELRRAASVFSGQQHQVILAHLSYAEIQILETIRVSNMASLQPKSTVFAAEPRYNGNGHSDPDQVLSSSGYSDSQYIWSSLAAVNACTSALLGSPASHFLGISFIQWEQLARCLAVLSYLYNSKDNGIYLAPTQPIADLPALLSRIIEKLTLTAAEAIKKGHESIFTVLASRANALHARIHGFTVDVDQPEPDNFLASDGRDSIPVRPFRPSQGPFQNPKIWIDQIFAAG
ncbi:hypothetical protein F4678DRAFT_38757 [Xylaria arbuscula]|nr:hypothetical protein F4678DRAFT_38757 [Xylaria arbuscula]